MSGGTITAVDGTITVVDDVDQDTEVFSYTLVGGTLDMLSADDMFDFNQDGTDEPANLHLILVKSEICCKRGG